MFEMTCTPSRAFINMGGVSCFMCISSEIILVMHAVVMPVHVTSVLVPILATLCVQRAATVRHHHVKP